MYRLYYSPGSASMAVHWMLIELGVPFELEMIDFDSGAQKSPEHLARNPSGQVPTLEIDGQPYSEVTALLMLLAERHPEAELAPAPGDPARAAYLQQMIFLANTMLPAVRGYFYPQDFVAADDRDTFKANAEGRLNAGFERMDAMLSDGRDYLLGERLTAADLLLTIISRWSRNMSRPADTRTHLGPYLAKMKQREGLRAVHEREGLTDWIDGKAA